MRDLKSEINKWVRDNNFKEEVRHERVPKHKTSGRTSGGMHSNGDAILQSRDTDVLSNRVKEEV